MDSLKSKRIWILFSLAIIISAAVFISDSVRDDDFSRFDSTYYTTISQNILRTGDWLDVRTFHGDSYNEHPPLIFWATALNLKLFGESVFSAVLFSLACGIGTSAVVFFIATILENDIAGFFSALGLLLTRYVPRVARHNTMEAPLMFFIALAILFLILALKKQKVFYLFFGLSTGLAVLTKGIAGLFPLPILVSAVIVQRKFRDFWNLFFLCGFLTFLIVPATWLFLKGGMSFQGAGHVLQGYGGFVSGAFQGLSRINPGSRIRFITRLVEFCYIIMPGVCLGIYFIARDAIKENKRELLTIPIWAVFFLVLFSISSWRRGLFLLPMYPAMAILFGIGLYRILPNAYKMVTVYLMAAFFAGNIVAPLLFPHWEPKSIQEVVFRNTYLPKVRKALKALYTQLPEGTRLISYRQGDDSEFIFFFSSNHKIGFCRDPQELENLANSNTPVLFYIPKKEFSTINRELHNKLKIVYSYDKQLLVTNQMSVVPVFNANS